MVEIKMDGQKASILFSGDAKDVGMEIAAAVSGIYQGIYDMSQKDAAIFKRVVQRLAEERSPVWGRTHEMAMIVLPEIK